MMSPWITWLLVADTYISIVYGPTGEYINARGLFEKEKKVMLLGAFLNITLSIAGTFVIGIYGVLLGTVICQLILWYGKSKIVFRDILLLEQREVRGYWLCQLKNLLVFFLAVWLGRSLGMRLFAQYSWISFLVNGVLIAGISVGLVVLFHYRSSGFAYMVSLVEMVWKRFLKKQ